MFKLSIVSLFALVGCVAVAREFTVHPDHPFELTMLNEVKSIEADGCDLQETSSKSSPVQGHVVASPGTEKPAHHHHLHVHSSNGTSSPERDNNDDKSGETIPWQYSNDDWSSAKCAVLGCEERISKAYPGKFRPWGDKLMSKIRPRLRDRNEFDREAYLRLCEHHCQKFLEPVGTRHRPTKRPTRKPKIRTTTTRRGSFDYDSDNGKGEASGEGGGQAPFHIVESKGRPGSQKRPDDSDSRSALEDETSKTPATLPPLDKNNEVKSKLKRKVKKSRGAKASKTTTTTSKPSDHLIENTTTASTTEAPKESESDDKTAPDSESDSASADTTTTSTTPAPTSEGPIVIVEVETTEKP